MQYQMLKPRRLTSTFIFMIANLIHALLHIKAAQNN